MTSKLLLLGMGAPELILIFFALLIVAIPILIIVLIVKKVKQNKIKKNSTLRF